MNEPRAFFKQWWFQIVFGGLAFLFLVVTLAGIAIELRELNRADEELKWRLEQNKDIDWYARVPASR